MKFFPALATTAFAVIFFSFALRAATPDRQPDHPSPPSAGPGDWRSSLQEQGVRFSLQSLSEGWANLHGGKRRGAVYTGLVEGELELDLEKLTGWNGATFHTRWMAPYGRDLSERYVGNGFTVSHAAARPSLYLYELWLEQTWLEGALAVRVGQLAADEAFAISEHGSLFLNAAFGWPPFLSENLPGGGPGFPRGTLGVQVAARFSDRLKLQSALYQGDPFEETRWLGLRWRPGGETGYLWMNEVQVRWNHSDKGGGLPGEIKGGFWYHTAERESPDIASSRRYKGNVGLYAVVDQMIHRLEGSSESSPRGVAWFGRVGIQPQERNTIGFYLDTGLTCRGFLSSRSEDALGLGFACGRWTRGARRTLQAEGGEGAAAGEMLVELTYHCQVTPRLALQPDVQWIIHPGATRELGNAWVVGLRSTWSF